MCIRDRFIPVVSLVQIQFPLLREKSMVMGFFRALKEKYDCFFFSDMQEKIVGEVV